MSDTEFVVQDEFRFALFPSLQFTCETGYVVQLYFIGQRHERSSKRPQVPRFRLFSNLSRQSFSNGSIINTALDPYMVLNGRPERAVLTSVMARRNFTRGDFIGITNPDQRTDRLSMLYHNNSGPTVYFQEAITNTLLESSLNSTDYPLLAVQTGKYTLYGIHVA